MDNRTVLQNSQQIKSLTKFCEKHDFCVMIVAIDNRNADNVLCHGTLSASQASDILGKISSTKSQTIVKDLPTLPTNYPELLKNQQETIQLANKLLKMYISTTAIGEGKTNKLSFVGSGRSSRSNIQYLSIPLVIYFLSSSPALFQFYFNSSALSLSVLLSSTFRAKISSSCYIKTTKLYRPLSPVEFSVPLFYAAAEVPKST